MTGFIGLDLGTSSLKAILIDASQRILAEHSVPLNVHRAQDGWSEQDACDWETAAVEALAALASKADCSTLAGIGLSGHMHGATLVGADDRPLRPCMLWNDTRSHAEAKEFDTNPQFREISGNIVFPGFTAPKVEWVRRNEPEIFAKISKILLPKDYLRLFLTGEYASEMSDAAGTSWVDTGKRDWSDELLSACHLNRAQMPRLVEGSEASGQLRPALAEKLGLPVVPVAGGAGDNAAAGIGAGVIEDGQAFLSLGTSGVLFAANDAYRADPETAVHSFCHALPARWHQMGVILAATDALEWLSRLTGQSAAALTADLGELQAPSRSLFLPYLGGERTPHNDASIRGQFLNLDHVTDAKEAARAVLEGVSFAFADCNDALAATGTNIRSALALGGGSRSAYWLDALATVLGFPLELPHDGEFGAALGAARLGMLAASDVAVSEVVTKPPVARVFEPNMQFRDDFKQGHARYRAAYHAIKTLDHEDTTP